jgi:hypothetical protein
VRRNATRYAILLTSGGFSLAMLASLRLWIPFYVVLGFVAGCLTRDLAWARVVRRTWPFSSDVADWDKIQRLADEADAA